MASSTLEYASTDAAPVRRSAAALLWRRLSKNVMSLVAFGVLGAVALATGLCALIFRWPAVKSHFGLGKPGMPK